jgi:hypothetical protein
LLALAHYVSKSLRAPQDKARNRIKNMARKPGTRAGADFVLFDVVYEDGTQRSNRKVPSAALGGLEKDAPARAIIEEQDREIAEKSGLAPVAIKSLHRSGAKPPKEFGAKYKKAASP